MEWLRLDDLSSKRYLRADTCRNSHYDGAVSPEKSKAMLCLMQIEFTTTHAD